MSDEMIVRQCAPTLAGIKTGSLFPCPYESRTQLMDEIRAMNHMLVPKGLCMLPVRCEGGSALLYVYRPGRLQHCHFSCKTGRHPCMSCCILPA